MGIFCEGKNAKPSLAHETPKLTNTENMIFRQPNQPPDSLQSPQTPTPPLKVYQKVLLQT